jgi:hypothetical protein
LEEPRFGTVTEQRLLAARTAAIVGRPLILTGCLPGKGFGEHLFRQDFAELKQQMFQVSQLRSPGRPVRTVELLDEVFGHPFDIGADIFHQRSAFLEIRHPELPAEFVSSKRTSFPWSV